jgi:hypothetical protein
VIGGAAAPLVPAAEHRENRVARGSFAPQLFRERNIVDRSCIDDFGAGTFAPVLRYPSEHREDTVEGRPFACFVIALVALIAVALWQFYSLAWGEGSLTAYSAGRPNAATHYPEIAASPVPASPD